MEEEEEEVEDAEEDEDLPDLTSFTIDDMKQWVQTERVHQENINQINGFLKCSLLQLLQCLHIFPVWQF